MPDLVDLQIVEDGQHGLLGVAECGVHVPFAVQRVFYLYDLPKGSRRGGHAHLELEQFLICLAGAVAIDVTGADGETNVILRTGAQGLHLPPMNWLDIEALEDHTVCLVLASALFDEDDYIRDRRDFDGRLRAGTGHG